MARFIKKILQPGTYTVDKKDGKKARVFIGKNRLKSLAENFERMSANGLRVPAPWRHDMKSQPVRVDSDDSDFDSSNNAGWWKKMWVGDDGALYGELSVPRREDSGKVGRTVTEVSPLIHPKWMDGKENVYEDAITHCALVTHPVQPNQENFHRVKGEDRPAVALSLANHVADVDVTALGPLDVVDGTMTAGDEGFDTGANGPMGDIRSAIQGLRLFGLVVPEDTPPNKFIETVDIAVRAALAVREDNEDGAGLGVKRPPRGAKEQPSPIVMSKEQQAEAATPEKDEPVKLSKEQEALVKFGAREQRKSRQHRIEQLVRDGKISPAMAEKKLAPMLDHFVEKFAIGDDGEPVETELDVILGVLEEIPEGSFLTGRSPTTVRRSKANLMGVEAYSLEGMEEHEPDMEAGKNPLGASPEDDEEAGRLIADEVYKVAGYKV